MIYRCIAPDWVKEESPNLKKVLEGEFTDEQIKDYNLSGYNIYFYPNHPSIYTPNTNVSGPDIDVFNYIFADMDLKSAIYADKESFISAIGDSEILPTQIVDSGNGIHIYYKVSDLDAMSFLTLQRRLTRRFNTDDAVSKICQLMRVPNTINTKHKNKMSLCEIIYESDKIYTCEELDKALPPINPSDREYCIGHYNKTYDLEIPVKIADKLPFKFSQLLNSSEEVKSIWLGESDDRSKSDFRLGHLMYGAGFTKEEALSVLANCQKAKSRAPKHRVSYASNIVDQIWTFEEAPIKEFVMLSDTVKDILNKRGDTLKGIRFPCWKYLDATEYGFRLGQVIGLVAGSGVGKTAIALNMFEGFVQNNPDYDHFFIPLEQPANEIADRWRKLCGDKVHLHDKVHVLSNYDEDGKFRHLSFNQIREYLLEFQNHTGRKIGCVVIDHIGAIKKKGKDGENQGLIEICHEMKAFAIETNTLLIMQSQSNRDKAGIGDLELNKDAAYGTVFFESYCDYLMTIWQPVKRCHSEAQCPTVTAYKFCKIRHKSKTDVIQEDICYKMFFDTTTETLRELTEDENKSFTFFLNKATNRRKQDRKTDLVEYKSIGRDGHGEASTNSNIVRITKLNNVSSG